MPGSDREQRGRRLWSDESERHRLIREHAGLVERTVGRIAVALPDSVDRENLMGSAILGLIRAVDAFEPERGIAFEQFAGAAVRRAVLEELRSLDWAPPSSREKCGRIQSALGHLEAALCRPPDDEEVAARLELSVEQYHAALLEVAGVALMSMSALLSAGERVEEEPPVPFGPEHAAAPETPQRPHKLKQALAAAIGELPRTEQLVIALFYHEELTFDEMADLLGMPASRVCEMHTQALLRLRSKLPRELGDAEPPETAL